MTLLGLYLGLHNFLWGACSAALLALGAALHYSANTLLSRIVIGVATGFFAIALFGMLTREVGCGRPLWIFFLVLLTLFQAAFLLALAGWPNETLNHLNKWDEGPRFKSVADARSRSPPATTDTTALLLHRGRPRPFLDHHLGGAIALMALGTASALLTLFVVSCWRPKSVVMQPDVDAAPHYYV